MNENQLHYLNIWKIGLREFLGWNSSQIDDWAKEKNPDDLRSFAWITTETPFYYVARAIVDQHFEAFDLTQRERAKIIQAVEKICKGSGNGWDFPSDYNFEAAKNQVNLLLSKELASADQLKSNDVSRRRVDVILNPAEYQTLSGRDLSATACVVFDILRATTTMITAFANGAAEIIPVGEIPEALELQGKDAKLLLAGERGGHRIRADLTGSVDFDFGNSPREFAAQKVRGRRIAITTTNGTRALRACAHAAELQIGAFLNLGAVAASLKASTMPNLLLVCAGTADESSMEDTLAAGALCQLLTGENGLEGEIRWTDAANMALSIYLQHETDLMGAMIKARNGRKLLSQPDLAGDVEVCLQRDTLKLTVKMRDGILRCE